MCVTAAVTNAHHSGRGQCGKVKGSGEKEQLHQPLGGGKQACTMAAEKLQVEETLKRTERLPPPLTLYQLRSDLNPRVMNCCWR